MARKTQKTQKPLRDMPKYTDSIAVLQPAFETCPLCEELLLKRVWMSAQPPQWKEEIAGLTPLLGKSHRCARRSDHPLPPQP